MYIHRYPEISEVWPGTPQYGPVAPQYEDCVQDGLVSPQDGLVTPSVWGLCADLSEKRPEYVKVM